MAFQDSVAQALTGTDAAANAPTQPPATQPAPNATAPTPQPEPTTTVPASDTLTSPTASAAPAQRPPMQPAVQTEQPEAPGEHFRNLSHALKGALLGVVAAGPRHVVDHYQVDDSGKMTPILRPTGATDRLKMLAQAALQGLAAGSRVPSGPNRGAQFARGLGAGFEAQQSQAQQQDILKRQQAQQQFEAEQKAMTDKAVRAMHNASTFRLWQEAMQAQNDHDPERAKNMDIVNSAKDYISRNPGTSLKVDILTPEQAKALHDADPNNIAKNTFLPIGFTQAKDENGQLLFEQDGGTPKQVGQIAVISGGKDGDKMPLPPSFIADLKEYGKLAQLGGADQFKAGQEVPVNAFLTMDSRLNQVKLQEIEGWKPANGAHVLKRADGTEVLVNGATGKQREATSTPGGAPSINLQQIQNELSKGATGERASEIAAGLQTQIDDPANAAIKPALQKLQTQANKQAQASTNYLAGKASAVAGAEAKAKQQFDTKPVYAIQTDAQGNQHTVMTTTAEAQQRNMTGIRPIKQPDIRADQHDIKVLNDIQVKSSNVRAAASVMDNASWKDSAAIAKYLADNPNTTLNQLMKSSVIGSASPHAVAYAIAINSLRESAMGLQKVLTGTARTNETQLQALQNTLPGVEPTADIVGQKLDAFEQNLVMLAQGLPENTGVQIKVGRGQAQAPNAPTPNQSQSVGHRVGDQIVQNGRTFKVTSVDANGKVTGAQ